MSPPTSTSAAFSTHVPASFDQPMWRSRTPLSVVVQNQTDMPEIPRCYIESGAVEGVPPLTRTCRKLRAELMPMYLATVSTKDINIRHTVRDFNFDAPIAIIRQLPAISDRSRD